ncbi:hypothetical protein C8R46DRAFT_905939 [Mycena filopes]|nr:hypothetical protein C8R46DRAFT_905939 [Mycena filopes]
MGVYNTFIQWDLRNPPRSINFVRSPPRSDASQSPAPHPTFGWDLLKVYTKSLYHALSYLSTTLHSAIWPDLIERDKVKAWIKEIGDRVKTRMVEIQPTGL